MRDKEQGKELKEPKDRRKPKVFEPATENKRKFMRKDDAFIRRKNQEMRERKLKKKEKLHGNSNS
jgi:hypothetical protein